MRNAVWTLASFLKTMEEEMGFRYSNVTADSGYKSEEGYMYLRVWAETIYKAAGLWEVEPGEHWPLFLPKSGKVRTAMNRK